MRIAHLASRLILTMFAGGCTPDTDPGAPGSSPLKLTVEVATLQEEPVGEREPYMAQLVSRHQVAVYPQVMGSVVEIFVKPGDVVKPGEPLLQIDPRREAANLASQVAMREQREANFQLAQRTEERTTRLFREGLASRAQFDQAKSSREVAERELTGQAANISAQHTRLDYFRIVAPFGGTVGDIPVKLGDLVSTQTKVTSVIDNSNLEAHVNLPIEKLSRLGAASQLELIGPTGNVAAQGPIVFIAPETDAELQSVLVKALIQNDAGPFRAAQVVRSRVVFAVRPGLRVPAAALTRQLGQYFVFVVKNVPNGEALARQRAVHIGDVDDAYYTVIQGLTAGERIAVSELQKLRDGVAVDAKEATSAVPMTHRGQGG